MSAVVCDDTLQTVSTWECLFVQNILTILSYVYYNNLLLLIFIIRLIMFHV